MTELERARAHLRERQKVLVQYRKYMGSTSDNMPIVRQYVGTYNDVVVSTAMCKREDMLASYETAVLAALSWVWEEQQKEEKRNHLLSLTNHVVVGDDDLKGGRMQFVTEKYDRLRLLVV